MLYLPELNGRWKKMESEFRHLSLSFNSCRDLYLSHLMTSPA
jgi:hypothetical protein